MKPLVKPDVARELSRLKNFQRDTVEHIFSRMYDPVTPTRRFLVADEVGLGKTLVARGLVAKVVDQLWDSVGRIDVIYICSNGSIARLEFLNGASVITTIAAPPYSYRWRGVTSGTYSLAVRATFLAVGIVGNAVATALYIGAGLGPGPRDGLMTGLARRGPSVRTVRTGLELTALAIGFVLGGSVGVGTVAYALAIGPLVQWALPRLTVTAALEGERCESRAVRT